MTTSTSAMRVAGFLLPPDVLSALLAGELDGLASADYHLGGENPREAAARTWTYLLGAYQRFRSELAQRPDGDPAIGITRERWLMLLFDTLGYGRLPLTPAGGLEIEGKTFPISHLWGATPMHLLGWGVDLDRRTPGVPGAAQRAPHAMVQEALNRTDEYLWAILSNGRALRLLRDSATLTGQAYVEFDLEAIFDAELFADYAQLYLLAHQSRVEVPDGGQPRDCWLERWRTTAVTQGVRALDKLREGVQHALETLGTGFLQHPANTELRRRLDTGDISVADLHQSVLRTVYRLLFWFVTEDRDALLDPQADAVARTRYTDYFSSARLRATAHRRHGDGHDDLWQSARLVLAALGKQNGDPRLGLPGLGGLFTDTEADVLATGGSDNTPCRLGNQPLLDAVRALSIVHPAGQARRAVDFRHLGAEELGSIYESLLELVPRLDPVGHTFSLEDAAGNDRKTSGSYYTPTDLVELVLDTALDPVLDAAEAEDDPEAALLAVTVCDPACGSGHFLVAAARRIATRLAALRSDEADPTPALYSEAIHEVVGRCIYGVDINPMAADLAKVSLWLEAMTPGRPLNFLDHHIKVGNALLGTTPALLAAGIPDEAYVALTGDDKKVANGLKKRNAAEQGGQFDLLGGVGIDLSNAKLRESLTELGDTAATATTLAEVAFAAQRYATIQADQEVVRQRRAADAWCVAFLGPKTTEAVPITQMTVDNIAADTAADDVIAAVDALAAKHRLFHWHLEFPDVFRVPEQPVSGGSGWAGGFTTMVGNPPWERVKLQEKEFFASRDEDIATAKNAAARKRAIAALADTNPGLLAEFEDAKRASEAESQFLRSSGRYPLCGVGDVNTYSVFAEHFRSTIARDGRSGIITPTGLATDATTADFFADTLTAERLAAFYDFENSLPIFEGVHRSFRFAVSSMTGGDRVSEARLAFFMKSVDAVSSSTFPLGPDEILLLNPNTGTLPVFQTRRDAEITLACYRRHPILIRDGDPNGNPWGLRFGTLFHMANDSDEFRTANDLDALGARFDGWAWRRGDESWLPLYEAKMLNIWNARFSTYDGVPPGSVSTQLPRIEDHLLDDPVTEPLARYWVATDAVDDAVPETWDRDWFLGWRDIARASDARTFVTSAFPKSAAGDPVLLAFPNADRNGPLLQAVWSSLAFDYVARQKLSGTHMKYFVTKQLACPPPFTFGAAPGWSDSTLGSFVRDRVMELTYTSHRLRPYAEDVIPGLDPGEPFRWVPDRRAQLMAELDAAMFHVYGLNRADAEHVLDSFPVVRKYEERDFGEFRTKHLVLTEYDAMARAAAANPSPTPEPILTGELQRPTDHPLPADDPRVGQPAWPYRSPLDPPPGQGPRHLPRPSPWSDHAHRHHGEVAT